MALDDALFTITDVRTFRDVDASFSSTRFAAYLKEVQDINLRNLLGDSLWYDFFINISATKYATLKNGTSYTYGTETIYYPGLKPFLCWCWLLKNLNEGNIFHTNRGSLQYNPETALPAERFQLQQIVGTYQVNIKTEENNIKRFLNENYATYPLWDIKNENKTTGLSIEVI